MPQWRPITGGGTPELVVDQTIGLEPSFRVYQLAAATREQPIQLNEISLQQTPVETSAYENALLLARHGLWSPALEVLHSIKERWGDRWPTYAQAQLDVVKLHAEVTQKNAERDWANPSEKLMAQVIDGRWELAWDSLIQGLQGGDDTVRLLRPETRQLWQRLSTASRITSYNVCYTKYYVYRQDGLIEKVHTSNIEPLHAELEHFVHCVRGGDQPSVGGEQALKALRLASLIEQMALDGQVWEFQGTSTLQTDLSTVMAG